MPNRVPLLLTLIALLLAACSHLAVPQTEAERSPVGKWVYQYLPPSKDQDKYPITITPATVTYSGNEYFRTEPTRRDPWQIGMRFARSGDSLTVEWLIADDPRAVRRMDTESSEVLQVQGAAFVLADGHGKPFATLTPVK
jgi:hypothetical protein